MNKTDNSFINQNIGLVHALCKKFSGRGIEYDDLFQAGCMGLVKAKNGFDESRGLKFSTYAVPVILGEIRHLFREGGSIKISRIIKKQAGELSKLREKYIAQYFKEPTVEELSRISGMSIDEVSMALGSAQAVCSLNAAMDEDRNRWQIFDGEEEQIIDVLSLRHALESLDSEDKMLIEMRYFKDKTQSQTAQILGISQVQVSRREKAIILKLREIMI